MIYCLSLDNEEIINYEPIGNFSDEELYNDALFEKLFSTDGYVVINGGRMYVDTNVKISQKHQTYSNGNWGDIARRFVRDIKLGSIGI